MFSGTPSLLANHGTAIHVLPASKIPTSQSLAPKASWNSYPPKKHSSPKTSETEYVIATHHVKEHLGLPSTMEFVTKTEQAMKVKNKFSALQDVKADKFYDIMGQVIRVFDKGDQFTIYLSDYTANSGFYNYIWKDGETSHSYDGDEFGYAKKHVKKVSKDSWPGPYGKLTLQLTLFDAHAVFAREQVKVGQWVLLKNVKIGFGRLGNCLEGFLRGDRNAFEGKVHVQIMEKADVPEDNDPRLIAAIERKLNYDRKFKKDKQDLADEASGKKRKREDEPTKMNSKQRRKQKRSSIEEKEAAKDQEVKTKLNLNENSKYWV